MTSFISMRARPKFSTILASHISFITVVQQCLAVQNVEKDQKKRKEKEKVEKDGGHQKASDSIMFVGTVCLAETFLFIKV